jgi:hypothetical protein
MRHGMRSGNAGKPCELGYHNNHATMFFMPTEHILALLVAERDKLNRAIEALSGGVKRRGRPPKSAGAPASNVTPAKPARKKRTFSAAQRKEQAARMKAYWAAKRKK